MGQRLTETDTGVQHDPIATDPCGHGGPNLLAKEARDIGDDRLIGGIGLHGSWLALHVHQGTPGNRGLLQALWPPRLSTR